MTVFNRNLLGSVKNMKFCFDGILPFETFYWDIAYNYHTAFQGFSLWEDGVVLKRTESVFGGDLFFTALRCLDCRCCLTHPYVLRAFPIQHPHLRQ